MIEQAEGPTADGPTRRSVLGAGVRATLASVAVGVGGIGWVAGFGDESAARVPTGADRRAAMGQVTTVEAEPIDGPVLVAQTTSAHHYEPLWMHTWGSPIDRLDARTAHALGVRFPKRSIMLTIDDGPHPVWTPRYLRLLARHHVSATFCVIGQQVRGNEHLLKAMVSEGHHIGNHTFHHPLDLPSLSPHAIRHELEDATDAVVRASGFRPRQFRAPGGVWGRDVFAEVSRQQMMPLGWDIDPRDWSLPGVAEIRRAMLASRPHDIILCHDGGGDRSETYQALKTVIPDLLARGWTFVTLPAPQ